MTTDREVERLLDLWIAEGVDEVNDRVLDTVEVQIGKQRQRPTWRLSWRDAHVNNYVKLAAGLAAVAIVAVAGYSLLPRGPGFGGPAASPTIEPTTVFKPFGEKHTLSVTAHIPSGWSVSSFPSVVAGPGVGVSGPNGIAIVFMRADGLFSDPCHWDLDGSGNLVQPGDVVVGPTSGDLVNALLSNKSFTASGGAAPGAWSWLLHLQLAPDISTCDKDTSGAPRYVVFSGEGAGFSAQGGGNKWEVRIKEVDGQRLIMVQLSYAATPQAMLDAARSIRESIEITP
jgi:hypothetical protein